jgi:hypothetical protein
MIRLAELERIGKKEDLEGTGGRTLSQKDKKEEEI